uniref:autophagy-related protein 13a n=1 Tax=Erigeron canadensis TaxID=72917 RepID=UPI001CB96E77|nr:autophagy-related protein 13a [Erigeron canadensis]
MDFLQYNSNNNNGNEHGRNEQIVCQFLLKTLHIVLESRVPSIVIPNSQLKKKTDKWFNLALGCDRPPPAALDSFNFWNRNLMEPMVIDIMLVLPPQSSSASLETVIERWVVQYQPSSSSSPVSNYKKTYKKSIILLRSLYAMMRLLPASRAYRKLSLSTNTCDFHIDYKLSSFCAPFTRLEEHLMKQYTFFPVEAQHGRLSISVKYRDSLSDFNLHTSPSFPPEIITDYVGSPATDPFRAFPTRTNTRPTVWQSPTPPHRPHSWTSGLTKGPPFTHNQSSYGSPPPAHRSSSGRYDFSSSPTDVYGQRTPSYRPPTHHRRTSFDDYHLSPPFSPSPSPSPPTYLSAGNYMQSRLRSETAPVSIPNPLMTRSPRYLSPNLSDPNRHSLPPPSPRSTRYEHSSHESPSGIRSLRKSEMSRVGDLSSGSGSGSANQYSSHKVSRDNKDDSGRFSGLLSSSGSPRIGFSRSSSRLSLQDELDDIDFSCPFIVDDVDSCDSPISQGFELSSHAKKSQDAAVGALVRMLRTAPPLRQDCSCYSLSDGVEPELSAGSGSRLFMPRKTSDALEELKGYRDIKHLILSKSGPPLRDV